MPRDLLQDANAGQRPAPQDLFAKFGIAPGGPRDLPSQDDPSDAQWQPLSAPASSPEPAANWVDQQNARERADMQADSAKAQPTIADAAPVFGPASLAPAPAGVQDARDQQRIKILQNEAKNPADEAFVGRELATFPYADQQRAQTPQRPHDPDRSAIDGMITRAEQDADRVFPTNTNPGSAAADNWVKQSRIEVKPLPPDQPIALPNSIEEGIGTALAPGATVPGEVQHPNMADITAAKVLHPGSLDDVLKTRREARAQWKQQMIEMRPEVLNFIKSQSGTATDQDAAVVFGQWIKAPSAMPASVMNDYYLRKSDLNPVQRGATQGLYGLWQASQGGAQAISDLIGTEHVSARMREEGAKTKQAVTELGQSKGLKGDLEGAINSILQQGPALVGGVVTKGAGAVTGALGLIGEQTFGQEYQNGTQQGLSNGVAAGRAGIFTFLEVAGEFFGFPQYVRALRHATQGVPVKQLAGELAHAITADIPGEQLTYLGEFLADKVPGMGLNVEAGLKDYLDGVRQTFAQTVMQGGIMGGSALAAHGATALHRGASSSEGTKTLPQIEPTLQTDPAVRQPREPTLDTFKPGEVQETTIPGARSEPTIRTQPEVASGSEPALGEMVSPAKLGEPALSSADGALTTEPLTAYTEKTAELKAKTFTKRGEPSIAVPHPTEDGKFAVVPRESIRNAYEQNGDARGGATADGSLLTDVHVPVPGQKASQDVMKEQPVSAAESVGEIDAAAHEAATSPENDLPEAAATRGQLRPAFRTTDGKIIRGEYPGQQHFQLAEKHFGSLDTPGFESGFIDPKTNDFVSYNDAIKKYGGTESATPDIDAAAHEAATSPLNEHPEPTDAQRAAGNFRSGHADIGGLNVTIQYPAGSERTGHNARGQEWSRPMEAHYGHITGVPARSPDKEHVDVYVKPGTAQDFVGDVFIVNQARPDTGRYDEVKTMLGYPTEAEAKRAYLAHYPANWKGLRSIVRVPMERFRSMLQDPDAFKKAVQPGETRAELAASGTDVGARVRVVEGPANIKGEAGTLIAGGGIKLDSGKVVPHPVSARFEMLGNARVSRVAPPIVFASEKSAQLKANSLTKAGTPSTVIAHPITEGKFAVIPVREDSPRAPSKERPALGMPESVLTDANVQREPSGDSKAQPDTAKARPDAIRAAITKLLNVPINERRFNVRKALGIYKVKPQAIRVRNVNDIDTISHEVGHHFSETNKEVRREMIRHKGELLQLTPAAYAKEPLKLRIEEGFAEFVRHYLTDPETAKAAAPQFHEAFEQFVVHNAYGPIFDELRSMIDQWHRLDPAERIMAKVGRAKKSIVDRLAEKFNKDRFIFESLDNWLPLRRMVEDLAPDIDASKDPFKSAHLLAGDAAIIEDWMLNGSVPFDYAKRADPKNYGKPLYQILKPVAKELRSFTAYVIAKRAAELKAVGKERLYTSAEIKAGLALETPAFKAAAKELYAYNDRLIDYAVEGGLLAPKVADRFREYTSYVPFMRERDDAATGGRSSNPFKKLTGGTANLRDPISNIIENTAAIVHATNRNAVLLKAHQLAQSVPGGGRWIEEIPIPQQAVQLTTQRIIDQLAQQGVKIDPEAAKEIGAMQTFFRPNLLGDKADRIVMIKDQGEPKALQINSRMLWESLEAFEPIDLGLIGTMLAVPSDLLRAGVTLSPEFMGRNFLRDTLAGFIQSQHNMIPVVNTIGGFKEIATRSDMSRLYRAFGGAYADLWKGESEQTRKTLERMAKRGRFDPRTILTPAGIIKVLHRLGSISEAGTRVAEFKKGAKADDVNSLIDGAYNAREVSVDFGMHGHNPTVRLLTRITPFLNPALQGWYKAVRTGQERFLVTLLRGSALTMFSVALYLFNRDKDWYDEIEKWERDMYWHLDVGLREKDGRVIPLRLPKPFEWGAVFASFPEALTEFAITKGPHDLADRLLSTLVNVFGLRTVPTAVLVPAELWANKDTFRDRPIVNEAKEGLDPELQFGPGTSVTARAIGKAADVSPAKIDHTIRGFLGTMGVYATMLADQGIRYMGDIPTGPKVPWKQMPVVKAFVHDPDSPNSRYVTEFYELLKKTNQASRSSRKHVGDEGDQYYERHKNEIDLAPEARRFARELANLRKQNEEVTASRDYTPDEKLRLTGQNNIEIKRLAKEFVMAQRDAHRSGQQEHAR